MKNITKLILLALCANPAYGQNYIKPGAPFPSSLQGAIRPGLELPKLVQRATIDIRPDYIDNSESPYFPPIVSQHGGSCAQASGIHYLFTYEMNRYMERPVEGKKSNIFSYRWTWNYLNEGKDQGSFASDGIEITQTAGCITVSDYGLDQDESVFRWVSGYEKYYNALHYRTKAMYSIDLDTREGIEKLMDYMIDKGDGHPGGGIASFSISGKDWGYGLYEGPSNTGIDHMILMKGTSGAHAMTLVGYDLAFQYDFDNNGIIDESETGAFILVNSWGTWWGNDGKAFMPFYYFLHAGEEGGTSSWDIDALCIDVENYTPTLTYEVTFYYSSRNDISLSMGVADGAQAKNGDRGTIMYYPIVRGQGGDFNMQGTSFTSGREMQMVLDYSSKAATLDTMKAPNFMFNVNQTALGKLGEGWVKSITVRNHKSGESWTKLYTKEEGKIKIGSNRFFIPTKMWYKNARGEWYVKTPSTANPMSETCWSSKKGSNTYSVRTADGKYATMLIGGYDESSRKLKLKFTYYE